MQRTNQSSDQKPKWRKKTLGKLYLSVGGASKRMRIKPGDEVSLTRDELKGFVDQFELIHPGTGDFKTDLLEVSNAEAVKEEVVSKKGPTPEIEIGDYELKHMGRGKWNVLSPTGKVMNNEKLTRHDAEALKEQLEAEANGEGE